MATIQGTHINIGYYASGTFTTFAYAKTATISMSTDMVEIASTTSSYAKSYIPSRMQWSMKCGCLMSRDETTIYNLFKNRTQLTVAFRDTQADGTTKQWCGKAYISSLSAQASINSMATFDIELQGTDDLTYEDTTTAHT